MPREALLTNEGGIGVRKVWKRLLILLTLIGWVMPHVVAAQVKCEAPIGAERALAAQITFFGDYHGTNEPPRFFFDVACTTAKKRPKDKILIALELGDKFNEYFGQLNKGGTQNSVIDLIRKDPFWSTFGDGRHSAAMLSMVEDLVALAAQSQQRVELVAVQRENIDSKGAEYLHQRIKTFRPNRTLVFIGNAHSRKEAMYGRSVKPFAREMMDRGFTILSFNILPGGGEGWFCMPDCKPKALPKRPDILQREIKLSSCVSGACPYDGTYSIPNLSVSAVRATK